MTHETSRNRLLEVPETLCSGPGCGAVKSLILDHNRLSTLPDSLGKLTELHRLCVRAAQPHAGHTRRCVCCWCCARVC